MQLIRNFLLVSFLFLFTFFYCSAIPIYWIGGSGSWDNPNHWSKTSGGAPFGSIPNEGLDVIIDHNSGLNSSSVITIPSGDFSTRDFKVQASANFEIAFTGNSAEMNVFGDLTLLSTHSISYLGNTSQNRWNFQGPNQHKIQSNGQDLFSVEFFDENGVVEQQDNLLASGKIRMHAGIWNTNSYNVESDFILFQDNNSLNNTLTKVFNAENSIITCEEFYSKLTYGSLTVTGNYSIFASRFYGSPSQGSGNPFYFNRIYLTEYIPTGGSLIEQNSFECTECIVKSIYVLNTAETKVANIFTLTDTLQVLEPGSSILFNGGNGRVNEVVIEGVIITPEVSECENRTVFSSVHTDFTTLTRTSGILNVFDAVINNIQTNGNATFKYSNSVLQGSSSGWTDSNPLVTNIYQWVGNGSLGNWNDPVNWKLDNGSYNGCIPKISDDVIIDNNAIGGIRIPAGVKASCRNFYWTNKFGKELKLDGTTSSQAELLVTGNFELHPSTQVTGLNNHKIVFSSATNNYITTNLVHLPKVYFYGPLGIWHLNTQFSSDEILFYGGTLYTEDFDIVTTKWVSSSDDPKHYLLGNSHVTVNGEFKLQTLFVDNVTVSPGTSLIECEDFESKEITLYDMKFINSSNLFLDNYPYTFHALELNGTGEVRFNNNVLVDQLEFSANNSELIISVGDTLFINESIESSATNGSPAVLRSNVTGFQVDVVHPFNLCATGHIEYRDISGVSQGIFNTPDGIDGGNNSGLTFSFPFDSDTLHWVNNQGGDWKKTSNWSRLSGGCPDTKNPDFSSNLMFDYNSFLDQQDTVRLLEGHNCGNLFVESTSPVNIKISINLNPSNLNINNGYAKLFGKNMFVTNQTEVSSGGFLSSYLDHFETDGMNFSSGLVIVRTNSEMIVTDVLENEGATCVIEQDGYMSAPYLYHFSGTFSVSGILKTSTEFFQDGTINVGNQGLVDATGVFRNYSSISGNYLIKGILENYGMITVKSNDTFEVRN